MKCKLLFLLILVSLLGCSDQKDDIIGVWNVNAYIVGKQSETINGTFDFQADGVLLLKLSNGEGSASEVQRWVLLPSNRIMLDNNKLKYSISDGKFKIYRKNYKATQDVYIELERNYTTWDYLFKYGGYLILIIGLGFIFFRWKKSRI